MVSFFKDKNLAVVFRLIMLSVVLHIRFFVTPPVVVLPAINSPLYYVLAPLKQFPSILISLLYHVVVIIQALRLNYLLNEYRMFPAFSYTTAMSYILFTSLLPAWTNISDVLIVNFLLLLLFHFCMRLTNTHRAISTIFNCGILTGVSIILYPPMAVIILAGLISILIIRSIRINEIFVYIVGSLIPVYFLGGILFLYNKLDWMKNLIPRLNFHFIMGENKISFFIALSLIGICVISGFVTMQNNFGKLLISARKLWIIVILSLVFLISVIFFSNDNLWIQTAFITLPACACIASNLFYYSRSKIPVALIFWLLVIAGLFNSFGGVMLLKK